MSVRPRQSPSYDAAAWAALRRRMLTKAVQYNEMALARLRTWLDELSAPQSGSAPPEAASISPSSPNDNGSNGAGYPDEWTPNLASVGSAPETVVPEVTPPPVEPEHSPLSESPWVPRAVAEAFPEPPPDRETSPAAGPRVPSQKHVSARPSKPSRSRTRKRGRLWIALASILLLMIVLAGGAVVVLHDWNSPSGRPSAGSEAFALPVLRHNRPRHFSVVLSRMALIARASMARAGRTSVTGTAGATTAPRVRTEASALSGQVNPVGATGPSP